jgi:hypothetical protein
MPQRKLIEAVITTRPDVKVAAVALLFAIQNAIGRGFHPDTPMTEYEPAFDEMEAHTLQLGIDFCHDILGEKVYQPDLWL